MAERPEASPGLQLERKAVWKKSERRLCEGACVKATGNQAKGSDSILFSTEEEGQGESRILGS